MAARRGRQVGPSALHRGDGLGTETALTEAIDEILETFEFFDDWEERYQYVIDLGKTLPPMADALKTDATKVKGCQSQVWLHARADAQDATRLVFEADSDAHIVRGLAAILLALYSGRTSAQIMETDSRALFDRLGLDQALSPSRANGLHSMDQRVKALAAEAG